MKIYYRHLYHTEGKAMLLIAVSLRLTQAVEHNEAIWMCMAVMALLVV